MEISHHLIELMELCDSPRFSDRRAKCGIEKCIFISWNCSLFCSQEDPNIHLDFRITLWEEISFSSLQIYEDGIKIQNFLYFPPLYQPTQPIETEHRMHFGEMGKVIFLCPSTIGSCEKQHHQTKDNLKNTMGTLRSGFTFGLHNFSDVKHSERLIEVGASKIPE